MSEDNLEDETDTMHYAFLELAESVLDIDKAKVDFVEFEWNGDKVKKIKINTHRNFEVKTA